MCSARRNPLKITGKTPKMHWKCPKTLPRIAMPNFDLFASTTLYLLPLHSTLNHILCCFSCMSIAKINFFRNSCVEFLRSANRKNSLRRIVVCFCGFNYQ